eukprot:jgi/Mesen1/8542/ME000484S07934
MQNQSYASPQLLVRGEPEELSGRSPTTGRLFVTKKLLLIGSAGVGKSSILARFADDVFKEHYVATIGMDFRVKTVEIDGKAVKLQVWDTAGQERFQTITSSYYRNADGAIIVYGVDNYDSFAAVQRWIADLNRCAPADAMKLLVGNKSDLVDDRVISVRSLKNPVFLLYEGSYCKACLDADPN